MPLRRSRHRTQWSSPAGVALRRGIALWREAGAPYETRGRACSWGEALQRHGAREHAVVEFEAALAAFESLGAELDLQRAARLLAYGLPDNQYLEFND